MGRFRCGLQNPSPRGGAGAGPYGGSVRTTFGRDTIAPGVDACLSEYFRHSRRVAWDEEAPGNRTVCPALML
jgi:hypothetical protein